MRALRIHGKGDLRFDDVAEREPGDNEVSIRVAAVGICGSDLHYLNDGAAGAFALREPLTPGHELVGYVAHDPTGQVPAGTRVAIHPATWGKPTPMVADDRPQLRPGGGYLGSASTWPHTQGGMVERLIVRRDQVRVLPERLPLRRAVLAEPLSVALHALTIAGQVDGRRVLVVGAGPIGLLVALAAQTKRAIDVTCADILPGPLRRARAVGAHTLRIGQDPPPVSAFDLVIECSGATAALGVALGAVRPGGVVVQVGNLPNAANPINLASIVFKEIELRGAFRFSTEIDEAVALLADHPQFEAVVTHVFPLESAAEAFRVATDADISGKVVIGLDDTVVAPESRHSGDRPAGASADTDAQNLEGESDAHRSGA